MPPSPHRPIEILDTDITTTRDVSSSVCHFGGKVAIGWQFSKHWQTDRISSQFRTQVAHRLNPFFSSNEALKWTHVNANAEHPQFTNCYFKLNSFTNNPTKIGRNLLAFSTSSVFHSFMLKSHMHFWAAESSVSDTFAYRRLCTVYTAIVRFICFVARCIHAQEIFFIEIQMGSVK